MANLTMLSTRIPKLKPTTSEKLPFTTKISTFYPFSSNHQYNNVIITHKPNTTNNFTPKSAVSSIEESIGTSNESEDEEGKEKFDWYKQWYPVMPLCDLDKRKPTGKKVIGIDIVVWWDMNKSEWKVFDDMCPHRLAPLSEGRIDQRGRLQCVYHGWCFNGSGQCKLIPQAPPDGPPVHTSKKACVSVYPSTVQNGILWFWANSDPEFKDILQKKKPPFMPALDDPSYSALISSREINYGYEALVENLMDPAHVGYAHYGILTKKTPKNKPVKGVDREGGRPLNLRIQDMDINGFSTIQEWGSGKFFAPCVYYVYPQSSAIDSANDNGNGSGSVSSVDSKAQVSTRKIPILVFICIPVSPGKSRLIWSFPRNFAVWLDKIIPKWVFHLNQNLVLDSDLYLLHVQERNIMEAGPTNWHKVCYVPTKADAILSGYRRWLNKYSNGGVNWGSKFNGGALPPTPLREELLDRYWTHTVNCSSCNAAYKGLNIAEITLQVISFGLIGVLALTKQGTMNTIQRSALFSVAILCFLASKWLSKFIYKNFHFHDYNHALI
ncbi:protochlorophyllide-dependent translocon component 52, chloroplastic-like [Amaranthus tricolor]|uniref:protochlorophyllide-dependent translocon component 52, chloroplastic-like n=1 Tax=Amaranthus tricolor TaxID=29722 RepID=UPI002584BE0E|nr:protochlorophyllide-dependent translocon component 52, chloroplastic-like [Amaranthus tricolor]